MGTNTRPHYCPFCGANLKEGDYFCRHCGKKIPHNKPITVVVDTMAKDFIKNADKADDKYANKNLELSGEVISRVKTDDSYYACLSQKTTYGKTYIVVSEIPIDHPEWIRKFQEGQRVKFIGTLLGMKKSDKDKNLYIIVVDIKSVK